MQMKEPDQFFGYNRERRPDESPFDLLRMVWCAWSQNRCRNLELARQETGKDFKLGQWFCSTGAHSETVVHGPFETSESAFDFAYQNFGVVRFMSLFGEP